MAKMAKKNPSKKLAKITKSKAIIAKSKNKNVAKLQKANVLKNKPKAKPAVKKTVKKIETKPVKKPVKKQAEKTIKKIVKKLEKKSVNKATKSKVISKTKEEAKKAVLSKEKIVPKKPNKKDEISKVATQAITKVAPKEIVKEKESQKESPKIQVQNQLKPQEKQAKILFKAGEYVVYPSHGIGKITAIETTKILNQNFECYLINFEKEKLSIKVPVENAGSVALRKLVSKAKLDEVFGILRSGVKKVKGMWSRRAQEYEAKINSGDIVMLAEVLRDLTRDIEDCDRSYSERIIYETAVARLAAEYSAIHAIDFEKAKNEVITIAKDKLGISSEEKPRPRDDFDDVDEEDSEEEEEEDDDFFDEDDDDDDKPRKKRK